MRLTVVGNPGNRRVTLFLAAVRAAGLPEPWTVSWRDVVSGAPVRIRPDSLVRVDSPGEDAEVDRSLRGAVAPAEPGEIVGLSAWYRGFSAALRRLQVAADAVGARLLSRPDEVLTMFDKRACHVRLAAAGVPVPPALPPPPTYEDLRATMRDVGWPSVFVKPAHGSSASGVVALATANGLVRATTSVELVRPGRLFNSLRVREYRHEADIASIVDALAPDGLQVERWLPKAGLGGRVVDLRVLVVAGRPGHVVVRGSHVPMTNLHLGGERGDLDALRRAAGETSYAAALATCERVATCFPGSLHVGVDLMFSPDWRRHRVAEVNAFGDLLPGLRDAAGRDTYAAEVAALLEGRFAAIPAGAAA
jgi:glutathione synthase/RimK-type ligase-like ATP-grasp enzyme